MGHDRRVTVDHGLSVVGSPAVSRTWSVVDFILIWLGGQFGGTVLALALISTDEDVVFLASIAGQYLGILAVLWLILRFQDRPRLGLEVRGGDFRYLAVGLALEFVVALVLLPLSNALFPDGAPPQSVAESLTNARSTVVQVTLVAVYVVVGPVFEEIMYRGVLLQALERWGKWIAIGGSAVVFAAVHFPGLAISGLSGGDLWRSALLYMPPFVLLGVVLAWLTIRSGRLGPAILLHSGWNLLAAFVLLLPPDLIEQLT